MKVNKLGSQSPFQAPYDTQTHRLNVAQHVAREREVAGPPARNNLSAFNSLSPPTSGLLWDICSDFFLCRSAFLKRKTHRKHETWVVHFGIFKHLRFLIKWNFFPLLKESCSINGKEVPDFCLKPIMKPQQLTPWEQVFLSELLVQSLSDITQLFLFPSASF